MPRRSGNGADHLAARMAAKPLVELAAALLGRFLRRRPTRRRSDAAQRVGVVCAQRAIPAEVGRFHVPARLALSQSHARLVRLERAQRRRENRDRQSLLQALQERLGSRGIRGHESRPPRKAKRGCLPPRFAKALCPASSKKRPAPISPRSSPPPASAPPTASSTASRASTTIAAAVIGNCTHVWNYETVDRVPVPVARAFAAQSRLRLLDGRCRRHALPPARCPTARSAPASPPPTARWARSCTRISTGSSPATRLTARHVAARQEGARIRVGPRRLGRQSRRRARRRAAQHLRRGVLRSQSDVRHLLSGRAARRRRDGARRGRYAVGRRVSPSVRQRQPVDRRQSVQRRILHAEDPRLHEGRDRAIAAQHAWARTIPRIRNIRWARAAWSISCWASISRDVAGLGPLLDRAHIQKTLASIYRYNYKRSLADHDTVQRTFALNDESAMVICDYGKARGPASPFRESGLGITAIGEEAVAEEVAK